MNSIPRMCSIVVELQRPSDNKANTEQLFIGCMISLWSVCARSRAVRDAPVYFALVRLCTRHVRVCE